MAFRINESEQVPSMGMTQYITSLHDTSDRIKRSFARRWYENNFFDDGYHFRFVHRTTGRVVDLSDRGNFNAPRRTIPKASRQIRGMANLMVSFDYHPVIYPRRVNREDFLPDLPDPEQGGIVKNPDYLRALASAKQEAKKKGYFIEDVWRDLDMFEEQIPLMILLAMKNSASFMQFWYDTRKEKILGQVYDAFDIDILGNLTNIEHSPFIGKVIPKLVTEVQNDPRFSEEARSKVVSDNKLAASVIKEGYMRTKFGQGTESGVETALQYEYFLKERLNENNIEKILQQEDGDVVGKGKKMGDIVIRQTFTGGGQTLLDKYVPDEEYPFVDFRMEPGPIWQTPQIERFIPANKSIDDVISKIEQHIGSNPMGIWVRQKGENFNISNSSNAYVLEYEGRPPQNIQTSPLPSDPFDLVTFDERFIEEQGVTTTAMGKIPAGVRANAAIETLKASEYSNLTMNTKMLKKTIEKIAQKIIFLAHNYIMSPRQSSYMDQGMTNYFDVMGKNGYDVRTNQLQEEVPDSVVVMDMNDRVRIEVETGPGYTVEGKRANMLDLSNYFMQMAQAGLVGPEAIKMVVEKLLDTYQFGSTAEFLEEYDKYLQNRGQQLDETMKNQIKVAVLEVLNDVTKGGGVKEPGGPVANPQVPPAPPTPQQGGPNEFA